MGAAILTAAIGLLRALPGSVLVGGLVAGAIVLFYEGVPPVPISIPFLGEISIIDGRVDTVRKTAAREARAECERERAESKRLAEQADRIAADEAAQRQAAALAEAERRRQAAEAETRDYEETIAGMDEALRGCRRATPDDARRLH